MSLEHRMTDLRMVIFMLENEVVSKYGMFKARGTLLARSSVPCQPQGVPGLLDFLKGAPDNLDTIERLINVLSTGKPPSW